MALFSFKHYLLFFAFLIIFTLNEASSESDFPIFLRENCTTDETFISNTTFEFNLRNLLSSLSSNITVSGGGSPSDTVYGLFLCLGDVPLQLCQQCAGNATQRLSNQDACKFAKSAVIWYEECLVRYSNRDFFYEVDTRPRMLLQNTGNVSDTKSLLRPLDTTLNIETSAEDAANSSNGGAAPYTLYAIKEATISGFKTFFCLTLRDECTPQYGTRPRGEDSTRFGKFCWVGNGIHLCKNVLCI